MRYLSFCLLLAMATGAAAAQSQSPSDKAGDKITPRPITLTGCVAAGTDPDTYLLSNVLQPDTPVGTAGSAAADVVYWLDSPGKLKGHVGQQVQITGRLDDDVKNTKIQTKDGKVELKQEGKKVEVPEGSTAGVAAGPDDRKRTSYKVLVRSVKMLSRSCSK